MKTTVGENLLDVAIDNDLDIEGFGTYVNVQVYKGDPDKVCFYWDSFIFTGKGINFAQCKLNLSKKNSSPKKQTSCDTCQ